MRLQDLLEMSELRNRTLDPEEEGWTDSRLDYLSYNAVERVYDILDIENYTRVEGKIVIPALSKNKMMAAAFINWFNPHSNDRKALRFVTKIVFYNRSPLSNLPALKNPLKVQRVYTVKEFRNNYVAGYLFALLAKNGHTIISDEVEYLGGKELWKKLARQAELKHYKIRIFNQRTGEFLTDSNKEIIEYNGENINEAIIWKENMIGRNTLLILTGTKNG